MPPDLVRQPYYQNMPYRSYELFRESALGAKAFGLKSHVLLSLRVKSRVFNQSVHKHPDVVLDLKKNIIIIIIIMFRVYIIPVINAQTWNGFTVTPALFFFFTTSISFATIWSTT